MVLLICMESQISRLERVESGTKDEDYMEEKDQEPLTRQSMGSPLDPVLPSTSYAMTPNHPKFYVFTSI